MANFPAGIRCSSLALVAGVFPGVTLQSANGNALDIGTGNRATGARIRLLFRGINAATLATLRAHYDSEGTILSWLLSADLLEGAQYASEIAAMRWRYVAQPTARDISDNAHEYEAELEHAPALVWVDTFVAKLPPLILELAGPARLLGPDVLPALWSSRLVTAGAASGYGAALGTMAIGLGGDNFQVFWFRVVGESGFRVAVVKRSNTGAVLWQRWTGGPFGDITTARDSYGPALLALPDGGCVVAVQDQNFVAESGTPTVRQMYVWRLDTAGATLWQTQVNAAITGPVGMVLATTEIIIGTEGTHKDIAPVSGFNYLGPALIRLSLATGTLQGAQVYKIRQDNESYRLRHVKVLTGGNIVFNAKRGRYDAGVPESYLNEVSPDGSIVFGSYGYQLVGQSSDFAGVFTVLPDGGYLVVPRRLTIEPFGYMRLNASMQVLNHYIPKRADGGQYNGVLPMSIDVGADGVGYSMGESIYLTPGIGALCINTNGSGFTTWSDVGIGDGIGSVSTPQDNVRLWQALDIANRRGVAHIAGSNSNATCRVTAIGFDLLQTLGTGSLTTPAATINTNSCGNTMSVRGYDPAGGGVDIGQTISRSTITTPTAPLPVTQTSSILNMTDPGAGLQWERVFYLG